MHEKLPQLGCLAHSRQLNTSVWALHRQQAGHLKAERKFSNWLSDPPVSLTIYLPFSLAKHYMTKKIDTSFKFH